MTDFNEVVYHPLDVIFAHQMLQKKAQGDEAAGLGTL